MATTPRRLSSDGRIASSNEPEHPHQSPEDFKREVDAFKRVHWAALQGGKTCATRHRLDFDLQLGVHTSSTQRPGGSRSDPVPTDEADANRLAHEDGQYINGLRGPAGFERQLAKRRASRRHRHRAYLDDVTADAQSFMRDNRAAFAADRAIVASVARSSAARASRPISTRREPRGHRRTSSPPRAGSGSDDGPGESGEPEPAGACERCGETLLHAARYCGWCREELGLALEHRLCAGGCGTDISDRRRDARYCADSACRKRAQRWRARAQADSLDRIEVCWPSFEDELDRLMRSNGINAKPRHREPPSWRGERGEQPTRTLRRPPRCASRSCQGPAAAPSAFCCEHRIIAPGTNHVRELGLDSLPEPYSFDEHRARFAHLAASEQLAVFLNLPLWQQTEASRTLASLDRERELPGELVTLHIDRERLAVAA